MGSVVGLGLYIAELSEIFVRPNVSVVVTTNSSIVGGAFGSFTPQNNTIIQDFYSTSNVSSSLSSSLCGGYIFHIFLKNLMKLIFDFYSNKQKDYLIHYLNF